MFAYIQVQDSCKISYVLQEFLVQAKFLQEAYHIITTSIPMIPCSMIWSRLRFEKAIWQYSTSMYYSIWRKNLTFIYCFKKGQTFVLLGPMLKPPPGRSQWLFCRNKKNMMRWRITRPLHLTVKLCWTSARKSWSAHLRL